MRTTAALAARFEDFTGRLDATSQDAREARDLAHQIKVTLREQDIVAKLQAATEKMETVTNALRQDVVASNTAIRKEIAAEVEARKACTEALESRLESLETARHKVVGVASFFAWLSKVGPWLFGLGTALVALMMSMGGEQ